MQSSTRAIHPQEYEYIEGGDFRVPLKLRVRANGMILLVNLRGVKPPIPKILVLRCFPALQ
jgi:hypothetical protein